jgi:hypothetical protein
MKKNLLLFLLIPLAFQSKTAIAQAVADTPIEHYVFYKNPKVYVNIMISGRVIGVNLEDVQGVKVKNIRTAESASTDGHGIFKINAAKGDTLHFEVAKYSKEVRIIKNAKENLNVIMIKRKTDELPPSHSSSDYDKAKKADNELYRILEKDAKLEGKWKY